jgi:aryl-alcohol dehydrogenase-like predicted oxidoreductase
MTLAEAALRFILASSDVTTVIPGMRRARHVDANLGISDGEPLPPDVVARFRTHRWVRTHIIV